ncbi:MAG: 50S ribosomal protein L15 [Desulfobacterales bacterium]|nr:50S ribosomal protein L15 [Desulfobacterales bacterium]MCP4162509.1 50S ribosomal protein L15 [Deltaproteobacteria bacterium]
MKLYELSPAPGSTKARKRIGRGVASGQGTTAGRGYNGQNSRSGGGTRPGYEGGQMPIHRRLPKRGFTNIFKKRYSIINVKDLSRFESGAVVDELALVKAGLVKGRYDGIKLLGEGDIDIALTIKSCKISETAKEKITKAGGTIEA